MKPGELHASVATPLAVVITELLQNAAEHAWPDGRTERRRRLGGRSSRPARGPAPGAAAALTWTSSCTAPTPSCGSRSATTGLACHPASPSTTPPAWACRSCATWSGTQMGGTITMRSDGGTVVEVVIPVDHPRTTSRASETGRPAGAPGARRGTTGPVRSCRQTDLEGEAGLSDAGSCGSAFRTPGAGGPARPCAACAAPPPRSHPRCPTPGWSPARTRDRTAGPRTAMHTALAASICSIAGPVLPIGKNRSGSVSRHAA